MNNFDKMIRDVTLSDAKAIVDIYNEYITGSTITFETENITEDEMRKRIAELSEHKLYFVYELEGKVVGYCYAHPWKVRAAYSHTLETTIYLSAECKGRGIGVTLMNHLIAACRDKGYKALIACITEGNEASCALHRKLGFKQVSCFEKVGNKFGKWLNVTDFELLL